MITKQMCVLVGGALSSSRGAVAYSLCLSSLHRKYVYSNIVKLSFGFNFNLDESWDSFTLQMSEKPTLPTESKFYFIFGYNF